MLNQKCQVEAGHGCLINSMSPGRCEWKFWLIIFMLNLVINGWGISCEITLRWMSLNLADNKSTLVQVMARCRQATSHYLILCWLRSMSPYGVSRPLWVKLNFEMHFQLNFMQTLVNACFIWPAVFPRGSCDCLQNRLFWMHSLFLRENVWFYFTSDIGIFSLCCDSNWVSMILDWFRPGDTIWCHGTKY